MKKTKEYYAKRFKDYPDVVTLQQFCKMLGGISTRHAKALITQGEIAHFFIKPRYYIPKCSVISFMSESDYIGAKVGGKV